METVADAGEKVCRRCARSLPVTEFWKGQSNCKGCSSAARKAWRAANRERANASDRQYAQTYRKTAKGKEITRDAGRARKARIRGASTVEKVRHKRILARDGMCCHICGGSVAPFDLVYDHVVPLSRGGAHSDENIKVAHRYCNERKGDRLMEELAADRPQFSSRLMRTS